MKPTVLPISAADPEHALRDAALLRAPAGHAQSVNSPEVNRAMKDPEREPRRKIVVLTLTEQCNLRCRYCFERAREDKTMQADLAKRLIAHEFRNSADFDELEFDLFGGEVTLYPELLQDIVAWTVEQRFGKPWLFFIETNGTLVHGAIQDWLIKMKGSVYAGLSLDGAPATHNRNRSGSYDRIDIPFFVKNYPAQPVRMTIASETVGTLAQDIIHLHGLGFAEITATFAHGVDWPKALVHEVLVPQLDLLVDFYLDHPELIESSIFDMVLREALVEPAHPVRQWCGTGTSMTSYDTNGAQYPCHTFQGFVSDRQSQTLVDFNSIRDFRDPSCNSCILESLCPNCYGMNLYGIW